MNNINLRNSVIGSVILVLASCQWDAYIDLNVCNIHEDILLVLQIQDTYTSMLQHAEKQVCRSIGITFLRL